MIVIFLSMLLIGIVGFIGIWISNNYKRWEFLNKTGKGKRKKILVG
jgi:hypothetical protein